MRCVPVTIALVLAVAAAMIPVAYLQLGFAGLVVLSAAALTILAAVFLSSFSLYYFAGSRSPVAGLLIAMSGRMLLPLVFVVAVLLCNSPSAPAWSAIYVAPLYFVMLIAETAFALRQCRTLKVVGSDWLSPLPHIETSESM